MLEHASIDGGALHHLLNGKVKVELQPCMGFFILCVEGVGVNA